MLCFRLFSESNPAVPLADAVAQLREGQAPKDLYTVEPASFQQIPNAPFAYWTSERIRRLFVELPALEGEGRTAKVGLQTGDDQRFVRVTWETPLVDSLDKDRGWYDFAKGGAFSPFYSAVYLRVNYRLNGREMEQTQGSVIRNATHYLKQGLTWPRRTTSGLSMRVLSKGCVFADKGPGIFVETSPKELMALLSICRSSTFRALLELQVAAADAAARSYEVGILQRMIIPPYMSGSYDVLASASDICWSTKRRTDTATLTSHAFHAPALAPGRKPQPTR
jgi:hypothetical protein